MFTVYILRSQKTGHLYTGVTSNITARLAQHNSNQTRSTKNRGPWEIVHQEDFASLGEAVRRERSLKSGQGRSEVKRILAGRANRLTG